MDKLWPIDNAVLAGMSAYLRISQSGGMPAEKAAEILGFVEDAARLNYFTIALSEHSKALLDAIERNSRESG